MSRAAQVLDYALFGNVDNMNYDENNWQITFEGDNYVVWDLNENTLHHFRVQIIAEEWDSAQAIEDQEWDIEDQGRDT